MPLEPGVAVAVDPVLGRFVVARRPFAVGEVVLRDTAALTWDDDAGGGHEVCGSFLPGAAP